MDRKNSTINEQSPAIEELLDFFVAEDGTAYYQVKWKPTWERADALDHFQDLIDAFWKFINGAHAGNLYNNQSMKKGPDPVLPKRPVPQSQPMMQNNIQQSQPMMQNNMQHSQPMMQSNMQQLPQGGGSRTPKTPKTHNPPKTSKNQNANMQQLQNPVNMQNMMAVQNGMGMQNSMHTGPQQQRLGGKQSVAHSVVIDSDEENYQDSDEENDIAVSALTSAQSSVQNMPGNQNVSSDQQQRQRFDMNQMLNMQYKIEPGEPMDQKPFQGNNPNFPHFPQQMQQVQQQQFHQFPMGNMSPTSNGRGGMGAGRGGESPQGRGREAAESATKRKLNQPPDAGVPNKMPQAMMPQGMMPQAMMQQAMLQQTMKVENPDGIDKGAMMPGGGSGGSWAENYSRR